MNKIEIVYTKEFVYFLGLLWSDGFIERSRTILEIIEDDALQIVNDIKKVDFLNICTMRRERKNRKPQMSIYFCNVNFYDIYQKKYFIDKSFKSPNDLLKDIPDELNRYFYLGVVDGDGCFYFNKATRQFCVTSSYEQDWSYLINLFKSIEVSQFEIRKVINKNGNKSSFIRVKKHDEINNIFNFLYPNGYEIGLKRKFLKCKNIIDNPPRCSSNRSKIDKDELMNYIQIGLNIQEISTKMKCNWRKIHDFCKRNNISKPKGFYKLIK